MVLKNRVINNAMWIIACRIVQAILALAITMLTARYLGPSNYGVINYAASIVAFVTPIMQLGLNSILVQQIVDEPENEGNILGTSLLMTLISSILSIIGVISFVSIVNTGESVTIAVCSLYSVSLIFKGLELIQYWFQAKLLSRYTSLTILGAYIVVSIYKIYLLISGKNIYWYAISQAFDYMIIAFVLLVIYRKISKCKLTFSYDCAKKMFSKSKYYIISGLMITIFAQTDRIMIKNMIGDAATGYYSAGVSCAGLTTFVFAAIIDSGRPVIFGSKNISYESFEKNMSKLYTVIIYLALLQSIFITCFSKLCVHILYGIEYEPTINVLKIIVWYTTFSYMGAVRDIWLLSENKQKYLIHINFLGAIANIILNYNLIPIFGINGAAIASFITQFFANFVLGFIFKELRRNNYLIIKSLNPLSLFK